MIEAVVLELYSSIDCTAKVLKAIYGKSSRGFPDSTRRLFANCGKITGAFPGELKQALGQAQTDWYTELLFIRDELTHLATGSCNLDHKTELVSYMHTGIKEGTSIFVREDIFAWLDEMMQKTNVFLGYVFHVLNSNLKSVPVQQICGFVKGHLLLRYVDPTERPLTFDSGRCGAYQWFELPENPTCPFVEHCGAYKRKMPTQAS